LIAVVVSTGLRVGGARAAETTTLPPMRAQAADAIDLVQNGGMEDADSKGWRFVDWPPRPETSDRLIAKSIFYSQDIVHSGVTSLCFDHATVGPDRILGLRQFIATDTLAPPDGQRIRISAWIWVASGPPFYEGGVTTRQWGGEQSALLDAKSFSLGGNKGEWHYASTEFTLNLGETRYADLSVNFPATPNQNESPICYVDDIKMEVLREPALSVAPLFGQTVLSPEGELPVVACIREVEFVAGLNKVRWNITDPTGEKAYSEGDAMLPSEKSVLEVPLRELPTGSYGLRIALGKSKGERIHEVLLPFRKADGPFTR